MTPEEAGERAKQKIMRGEVITDWDVAGLCASVHRDGYKAGFESAYREMARLCEKHLPSPTPTEKSEER